MKSISYDVIVAGGGTAGVIAAVQASRAGAKTLLIEKSGMLGGTITMAAVNFPAVFIAGGKQVIAGIGWELIVKTLKEEGKNPPDPAGYASLPKQHSIKINSAIYAMICDQEVLASGSELLLHSMPAKVKRTGKFWKVTLCTKEGFLTVSSKVLIDCTGDANIVKLAGFKVKKQPVLQPATYIFSLKGYDFKKLNTKVLCNNYRKAVKEGYFKDSELGWGGQKLGDRMIELLRNRGNNSIHVSNIDATGSKGKTALEVAGRALILKIYRWLRKQPGLDKIELDFIAPECGVRETVVIDGETCITIKDYESGRHFQDAVCYSYYPVDVHTGRGKGLIFRHLRDGVLPTIPRGAMLPKKSSYLIAAGRHISGDREANSAYRVEASCMAMGQAAGAMAALSAQKNIEPKKLPLNEVLALLEKYKAVVPR